MKKTKRNIKNNIISEILESIPENITRLTEINFEIANKFADRLKELNIDYRTLEDNERSIVAASKQLTLEKIVDLELKYDFKLLNF